MLRELRNISPITCRLLVQILSDEQRQKVNTSQWLLHELHVNQVSRPRADPGIVQFLMRNSWWLQQKSQTELLCNKDSYYESMQSKAQAVHHLQRRFKRSICHQMLLMWHEHIYKINVTRHHIPELCRNTSADIAFAAREMRSLHKNTHVNKWYSAILFLAK